MKKFPILVVEDVPDLRSSYMRSLERAGYVVHGAASLQEAEQLLSRQMYSGAVIDVNLHDARVDLGDKGGIEIVRLIKEKLEGTVCMMLTGQRDIESGVFAGRMGAVYTMLKNEIEDQSTMPRKLAELLLEFKPRLLGEYTDVVAYLCRPQIRDIWEYGLMSNMGLDATKFYQLIRTAFDDILPIRRLKNSTYALAHDSAKRHLRGSFWSRAEGCGVTVDIQPSTEGSSSGTRDELIVDRVQFGYRVQVSKVTQMRLQDFEELIDLA